MSTTRIGVIGDLHTHWDELDVAHFDRSDYDLLLFTGDLGGGSRDSSLRVARMISRLRKPTLVMPGNNDTGDIGELAAELAHRGAIRQFSAIRQGRPDPSASPGQGQPAVRLCGYSSHLLGQGPAAATLIAGRPHSMGGDQLSFGDHMAVCLDDRQSRRIGGATHGTRRPGRNPGSGVLRPQRAHGAWRGTRRHVGLRLQARRRGLG
jgi:hypothetical protein